MQQRQHLVLRNTDEYAFAILLQNFKLFFWSKDKRMQTFSPCLQCNALQILFYFIGSLSNFLLPSHYYNISLIPKYNLIDVYSTNMLFLNQCFKMILYYDQWWCCSRNTSWSLHIVNASDHIAADQPYHWKQEMKQYLVNYQVLQIP